MSDELLQAIDEVVGPRGRSRFLEEAAREKLGRLELLEALLATKGIARGPGYEHWKDRETSSEWVRRIRRSETET
jgi:hypothetical protein